MPSAKWGSIKLRPDHSEPAVQLPGRLRCCFSAATVLPLLFFCVAEPVLHYAAPPSWAPLKTVDAASTAMQIAFVPWGFHIWAIYAWSAWFGLFFLFATPCHYQCVATLSLDWRSHFMAPIGHTVDVFADPRDPVRIATTLGLSFHRSTAGLNYYGRSIPGPISRLANHLPCRHYPL